MVNVFDEHVYFSPSCISTYFTSYYYRGNMLYVLMRTANNLTCSKVKIVLTGTDCWNKNLDTQTYADPPFSPFFLLEVERFVHVHVDKPVQSILDVTIPHIQCDRHDQQMLVVKAVTTNICDQYVLSHRLYLQYCIKILLLSHLQSRLNFSPTACSSHYSKGIVSGTPHISGRLHQ